jgi:hypothetical protein
VKRLSFRSFLTSAGCVGSLATVIACGGSSDPTDTPSDEHVAKVTGALTVAALPDGTANDAPPAHTDGFKPGGGGGGGSSGGCNCSSGTAAQAVNPTPSNTDSGEEP